MTEQDFALYIPSMQSTNDIESVKIAFEGCGIVSHVEFIDIVYPFPSRDFCRAVVYFSEWTEQSIVDRINEEGKFIFKLEDKKNYWILKKHRAQSFAPNSPSTTISSKSSADMSLKEAHFPLLPQKKKDEKEESLQMDEVKEAALAEKKEEEEKKEDKEAKEVNEEVNNDEEDVVNDDGVKDESVEPPKGISYSYQPITHLTPITPLPFYQHHDSIREIERLNQEVSRLKVELQSTIHFYQGQMEYISGFYQSRMNSLAEERSTESANLWRILRGVIEDEN